MPDNGNVLCQECQRPFKVVKCGLGFFYFKCKCREVNQGLTAEQICLELSIDEVRLKKISKDLMITDVCC